MHRSLNTRARHWPYRKCCKKIERETPRDLHAQQPTWRRYTHSLSMPIRMRRTHVNSTTTGNWHRVHTPSCAQEFCRHVQPIRGVRGRRSPQHACPKQQPLSASNRGCCRLQFESLGVSGFTTSFLCGSLNSHKPEDEDAQELDFPIVSLIQNHS